MQYYYFSSRALAWLRAEPEGGNSGVLFPPALTFEALSLRVPPAELPLPASATPNLDLLEHQQSLLLALAPGGELARVISKETVDRTAATRFVCKAF